MSETYQCCFCGEIIDAFPPDVGGLLYTIAIDQPARDQTEQQLYCHTLSARATAHVGEALCSRHRWSVLRTRDRRVRQDANLRAALFHCADEGGNQIGIELAAGAHF